MNIISQFPPYICMYDMLQVRNIPNAHQTVRQTGHQMYTEMYIEMYTTNTPTVVHPLIMISSIIVKRNPEGLGLGGTSTTFIKAGTHIG